MTRRRVTREELDSPLLGYDEAIAHVAASFVPLEPVTVEAEHAAGLVLARNVVAHDDVPAFDNSAMDGYAVSSARGAGPGVELELAERVDRDGVATKVMTGQPIPEGADAVVPWEHTTDLPDGRIRLEHSVSAGQFVRPCGGDVVAGSTVLDAGAQLAAVELGVLAAVGATSVVAHPRPRVGLLSSGDELVAADQATGPGTVRDVNTPLLQAACVGYGAQVTGRRRCPDDPDTVAAALHELAAEADLIVTSGGASVGEKDWLRVVLEREGGIDFWRVALRPGKPVALASVDSTPVIMLPGNPGSVLACAHVFVARALRRLAGRDAAPRSVPAALGADLEGDPERTVVHPVRIEGSVAHPLPVRSSQVLSNAIGLDGWLIVPLGGLRAGAAVRVELTG